MDPKQRYKSKYTGPQMDVALERALPGGAIDQSMSAKLDWEGLINPEFTVAQAGIGGNHGSVPYAADCWKLVSGTVSAAPGGGLVLNGTIRQTLETAAGLDAVASINVTSGTATAAYDDAARQFDITSSGGTIKRAHLGLAAIADWSKIPHVDNGNVLWQCKRRFVKETVSRLCGVWTSGNIATLSLPLDVQMREVPVAIVKALGVVVASDSIVQHTGIAVAGMSGNLVNLQLTMPSSATSGNYLIALADAQIEFSADID